MFAVVSLSCTTGYYSYGHEMGHNFGMMHDRGSGGSCTTPGYNFGYRSPTAAFRSILAYSCATGQCDNMPLNGCTRVQRFSNNQTLYNGQAIGDANNNNALQFNNKRATVAAYFPAMNCQSDNQCNDNNANTVDTCNVAKAVCVFTVTPSVPTVPTPVVAPSAPIPVAAPSAPTPVDFPSAPTPVDVPSAPTPIDAPSAATPVDAPSAPTPVDSPTAETPVDVPSAPTPVDSPTAETPVAVSTFDACGLFGMSIFCPFTLCGLFGRLLGFCGN
jgi:Metallo-peptidase family M12B Reprolysin-like